MIVVTFNRYLAASKKWMTLYPFNKSSYDVCSEVDIV